MAKTSAHDRLGELDQAIREANERLNATVERARRELEPIAELQATEAAQWSAGDEAESRKTARKRAALEAEIPVWQRRAAACQDALERAEQQRRAFIEHTGDALIDEQREEAAQSRERLETALREVVDAYGAYMRLQGRLNGYSGDHRRHRHDVPALGAVALAVDRALAVGVPDPVPAPAMVVEEVA